MGRAIFLLLMLAGCGSEQCTLAGTWKAGLGSEITFQSDGTWYSNTGLGGAWQLQNGTLTVSGGSCATSFGTYSVGFSGACQQAGLHVKADSCADRVAALDGLSLTILSGAPDLGGPIAIPDLSVKRNPDLVQPLFGCSGTLSCLSSCGGDSACRDDCLAGVTQRGTDLLTALDDCLDTNCFQMNSALGTPFCDANSADPEADPGCSSCYNRVLGNGGACKAAHDACLADKP